MQETYISATQIGARYAVNDKQAWRWLRDDPSFPKPLLLSKRCARWKLSEIEAWEASRAAVAA